MKKLRQIPIFLALFFTAAIVSLVGCSQSTFNQDVQKVILAESIAKSTVTTLEAAIEAQIPSMAPDKQTQFKTDLATFKVKWAQTELAKDTTLQGLSDASQQTVNISALMRDILTLIPEIIALAQKANVDQQLVGKVTVTYNAQRLKLSP
jgi:hypothetical protein